VFPKAEEVETRSEYDAAPETAPVREVTGEGILVLGQGGDPAYFDDWTNLLENVRVHGNSVKHTAGDGIFVNGANNELIDHNNVFGVGSLGKPAYKSILFDSSGTGAEVGIFVMQHKKGIIEYNQVDSTYMPCGDAQAIDNDGCLSGTTLIQYNYGNVPFLVETDRVS
jgi:hypothetical protein